MKLKTPAPFLVTLILCIVSAAQAQFGYDLSSGLWQGDFSRMNADLVKPGYQKFKDQFQVVGISGIAYIAVGSGSHFNGKLGFDFIIPHNNSPAPGVSARTTGFSFGLTIGKSLFPQAKRFDLLLCLGANTGIVILIWNNAAWGESNRMRRNPFFAPVAMLQPSLLIGRLSVGMKLGYQYDISSGSWRYSGKYPDSTGGFFLRGYIAEVTLRFRLSSK
jgi:hypothetical protein